MFRINKLTLYSFNDEEYTYEFSMGINYFKGKIAQVKQNFINLWILCLDHLRI